MAEPKSFTSWKVVILCFIGATTFWFFSALGKNYNYRIKYPIEFVFDTDSLIAVKPLPQYVDIDVSGGGWDLFKESFWFGTDPVMFDLENPVAIRFLTRPTILPILTEELSHYRVNFLYTDTLFIDIDRKSSKKVILDIDSAQLSMEDDYRLISPISIMPDTAVIYGPTSFLDTLKDIYSIKLDYDEIDEDFTKSVDLNLPEGFEIYSEPAEVTVEFSVEQFIRFELESVVEMINFPADSSVYVTYPEVKLQYLIQESKEEDLYSNDFKVIVDYGMIDKSDSTVPAIVIVQPEQVIEVEVIPDTLSISYER